MRPGAEALKPTKILIYKRTHDGDPDNAGRFGIQDCMGRVRSFGFDGVIGVGGVSAWPVSQGLDRKVNWVGLHPQQIPSSMPGARAPVLQFAAPDFALFEHRGPQLADLSKALAKHVYGRRLRYFIVMPGDALYDDACNVIASLLGSPPVGNPKPHTSKSTKGCRSPQKQKGCRPRCR